MRIYILLAAILIAIPAFSVEVPHDQEVCFSPDEACDAKLAALIGSAQKSIDIAIYDINIDQVVHQILVQSKKIKVRVVVDKMQSKGKHSLVSTLVKAGVSARYGHQRGIMHDKFTIIDGKMLETGSFNYTNHASAANQENQIYLSSPAVLTRYNERFTKIWESAKPIADVDLKVTDKKGRERTPSGE